MSNELYREYRPTLFKQVVGQDAAVKTLQALLKSQKLPHCLLFTGPSGCGKTTLARILKTKLDCHDRDFAEINAADDKGIDMVRFIKSKINLAPMKTCRIYLIDEAHQLTAPAQDAFLKTLEDTPSWAYIFICTTDPHKLKATIKTRSTEIKCRALTHDELVEVITSIAGKREKKIAEEVAERIIELAEGSARKALVLLHQIIDLPDEDQLTAVMASSQKTHAYKIFQGLINGRTSWPEMTKILNDVPELETEFEGLRHLILACCKTCLLKGVNNRAMFIIQNFKFHFFDSKAPGFVAACYEVVNSRR